jgi:hypothetical protein
MSWGWDDREDRCREARRLGSTGGRRHAHPQHPSSAHATSLIRSRPIHSHHYSLSPRHSTFCITTPHHTTIHTLKRSAAAKRRGRETKQQGRGEGGTNRQGTVSVHPLYKNPMPSPSPAPSPSIRPPIPFHCSVPASAIPVVSSKKRALIIGYGLGDHLDHTGSSTSCWVNPSSLDRQEYPGRAIAYSCCVFFGEFFQAECARSAPSLSLASHINNNSDTHLPCCAFLSSHCLVLRIISKHLIITSSRREKPILLGAVSVK